MVKDELGRDAVILHTKRYRKGGLLGFKSKEIVEVTAAVDDTPRRPRVKLPKAAKPAAAVPPVPAPARPKNVLAQYKTAGTEAGVTLAQSADLAARLSAVPQEDAFVPVQPAAVPKIPVAARAPMPAMPPAAVPAEPVASVLAGMPVQTAPAAAGRIIKAEPAVPPVAVQPMPASPQVPVPEPQDTEKIQALEQELAQMKAMLEQVISQKHEDPDLVTLQDAMQEQEIDEAVLQDMIRNMPAGDILSEKESERAFKALSDYLHDALKMSDGIILKDGRPKIVALIGTTGVGKTTTLAKIAAKFVLERGISAALITADTYRISAVDQLKTYSDIIGLPLEIVYSPAELKTAIRKFRNKQLILIDTAGRSQKNDYQMQELQEFLEVEPEIEKHLVLSATTKSRDAMNILERFSACKPDRILFTKTDETTSLGFIVNLLFDKRITLSYLTNGQSVPDDIAPASAEILAKLLLR